jgi:hypothetical protein
VDLTKKRIVMSAGAILIIGLQAVEVWQILSLRKRVADAEWMLAYQGKAEDDTITADVGSIQFLRHGYSIQVESAKYT